MTKTIYAVGVDEAGFVIYSEHSEDRYTFELGKIANRMNRDGTLNWVATETMSGEWLWIKENYYASCHNQGVE